MKEGFRSTLFLSSSKLSFAVSQFNTIYIRNIYPLFFENTLLAHSSTRNILGLSFTKNLNWKLYIPTVAKSTSLNLHGLYRPFFFSLSNP